MKAVFRTGVGLLSVVCLAALIVSVYPGVLQDILFVGVLLSLLLLPVVGVVGLVVLIILEYRGKLRGVRIPRRHFLVAIVLLCVTYGLLKFYIPRRIAFSFSRAAFEQLVLEGAPAGAGDVWAGVYHVEDYESDPRGGVFFRVHTGFDGIGPDQMSYGFAFKANAEGTPFGAARYRRHRLGGGWCWFKVSDDWY